MEFEPMTNCITNCNHLVKTCNDPFIKVGDVKVFHTYLGSANDLIYTPFSHLIYASHV